jgi:hypothetical protein
LHPTGHSRTIGAGMSNIRCTFQAFCLLGAGVVLGRWTTPVSTVSAQVSPADDEMALGTVPVRLGMKQDVVLRTLGKEYKLEHVGQVVEGVQFWTVRTNATPSQSVGSVQFKQDRLLNVSRTWGETDADDAWVSFFRKVYGAFDSASSRTRMSTLVCTISRNPTRTLTVLTFTFGNRRVNLSLSEYLGGEPLVRPFNSITVDESVRVPGTP